MARTTTDPKPLLVTIRLSEADLAHLDKLAEEWGVTRSEVFRRLLRRTAKRKG
jgi:metal-responsive CopG/Arc/MetJ family transcriptional regulator